MELHRLKHIFIETLLPIYADQQ
ncbi:MAG: hypothetical protein RLY43_986, partial [Bacteroidota bacterium]